MAIIKWNELQLKFDLPELDETEEDARERMITPEEARLISEAARGALDTKTGRTPDWMKDYIMLREQGWPWRLACYIAWAGGPKLRRWPETLQELATEVLGLTSPRVIYTWRQKYASINTVVSMFQAQPLFEHRREIITALVASAVQPDYKGFNDRKLALEMLGDYTPKSKLEVAKGNQSGIGELSDTELYELMGEIEEELKNKQDEDDTGGLDQSG